MSDQRMTWKRWAIIAGVMAATLASGWAMAQEASTRSSVMMSKRALAALRRLPIQHQGRHKPFESFARETLDHVTGSPRIDGHDPVVTVLSMIAFPEEWQVRPMIWIPFRPLRVVLGMDPKRSHSSHEELVTTKRLMRLLPSIVEKQQRDEKLTMLEQETMDAFDRFVAFSNLVEHRLELVPSPPGNPSWRSIQKPSGYSMEDHARIREAWASWMTALRAQQPHAVERTTTQLISIFGSLNPAAYPPAWRLDLEVWYHRSRPFHLARLCYLIAALGLLGWLIRRFAISRTIGMAAFWIGALLHAAGIVLRMIIGGRPPVSNFFETMLWLPFVGVVLALVFERIYRADLFALAASVLAAIMLVLADLVPLDSGISPVVAVLRSNLWLTIHVLTIVASYGALDLAAVLAHFYGVVFVLQRNARTRLASIETFLYRTIQVGVVLLAGGVMLGAVWANASWGRYWGWDPKETWALITLLWFLAVLHGRFAGWLTGIWLSLATIGGFLLLLMTYYGVSFYLVGLHSYAGGHAKPLPTVLIAYLLAEVAFMTCAALVAVSRMRRLS